MPFFFQIGSYPDASGHVVHGDITRFFAGDPTAGILSGAFLFKMWGLPAAGIAIWQCAKPAQRAAVGGIMVSAALTSFLTGITEPLEFSFLFVAPILYLFHAALAASTQFVANTFHIRMGFTFSQGGIDFLLFNVLGKTAHNWWMTLILGPLYAAIYYTVFRVAILRFNLKTPGRDEDEYGAAVPATVAPGGDAKLVLARQVIEAFGGAANIETLDSCITRLRVAVHDIHQVDTARFKTLGAVGVMVVGNGLQVVFGTQSENLKTDMDEVMAAGVARTSPLPVPPPQAGGAPAAGAGDAPEPIASAVSPQALWAALGGKDNIREVIGVAGTRLRIELADPSRLDKDAAQRAGARATIALGGGAFQIILGPSAARVAAQLHGTDPAAATRAKEAA